MIAVAVVTHPQRAEMAHKLAVEVGGVVVLDTEGGGVAGCVRNHADALRRAAESTGSGWLVVLEDDAVPVPDFRFLVTDALAYACNPLVSLYLGTGTNPVVQDVVRAGIRRADSVGAAWIRADCLMSTVGYAVRHNWVNLLLRAFDGDDGVEAPLRVTRWAQRVSVGVDYTWPSLVDHRDGWSTIAHHVVKGRRAHRCGVAPRWDTGGVSLGPVPGWSAP